MDSRTQKKVKLRDRMYTDEETEAIHSYVEYLENEKYIEDWIKISGRGKILKAINKLNEKELLVWVKLLKENELIELIKLLKERCQIENNNQKGA